MSKDVKESAAGDLNQVDPDLLELVEAMLAQTLREQRSARARRAIFMKSPRGNARQ